MAINTIIIHPNDNSDLWFSLSPKRSKTVTGTYSFSTTTNSLSGGPFSSTDSGYSYSNYQSSQYKIFSIDANVVSSLISVKLYAKNGTSFNGNFSALMIEENGASTSNNSINVINIPISKVSTSTKINFLATAIRTFSGSDSVVNGNIQHTGQYYSDPSLNVSQADGKYEKVYRTDTYSQTGTTRSGSISDIYLEITYGDGGSPGGGEVEPDVPYAPAFYIGIEGIAREIKEGFIGIAGIARKIKEAYIGINGIARKFYPGLTVASLRPGDVIQLEENEGVFADWIVMHQNYYGEKQTVLMRKNCLYDNISLAYEGACGMYAYPYFEHDADNYLRHTWYNARLAAFQELLISTTITGRTWSGGTVQTAERKIWLPSAVNLSSTQFTAGSTAYDDDPKGAFDYFTGDNDANAARVAYRDQVSGTPVAWWTRTTLGGTHPYCYRISTAGDFGNTEYYNYIYLRPVINISAAHYLEPVGEGIYRMIGGGNIIPDIDLINFFIDGVSYQAESGMSWGTWVNSLYNTGSFIINPDDEIVHSAGGQYGIFDSDGYECYSGNPIKVNTMYEYGPSSMTG